MNKTLKIAETDLPALNRIKSFKREMEAHGLHAYEITHFEDGKIHAIIRQEKEIPARDRILAAARLLLDAVGSQDKDVFLVNPMEYETLTAACVTARTVLDCAMIEVESSKTVGDAARVRFATSVDVHEDGIVKHGKAPRVRRKKK